MSELPAFGSGEDSYVGRQPGAKRLFNVVRLKGPPLIVKVEQPDVKAEEEEGDEEEAEGEPCDLLPYPDLNLDEPILKQIYHRLLFMEQPSQKAIGDR